MKVLSLFDGMACGALALQAAGIPIESYDAFEIDKYAIQTAVHNFPFIKQHGDVFEADFTEFEGVDLVCGGSPCTYWSIAQKNNRETEASGMGWELFSQYVRAIKEAKPKCFVYENNKSMSNAIRESISDTFGFEPVYINSALVSAQNRQRLYWVGRRNEDGTYSKVDVKQPEDGGIVLRDILESGADLSQNEKAYCLTANYPGAHPEHTLSKSVRAMVAEPIRIPEYGSDDKARPLNAHYSNNCGGFEHRMFSNNPSKQQVDMVAQPIVPFVEKKLDDAVEKFGYIPEMWNPYNNAEIGNKAPTQTAQCGSQTNSSTVMITEPMRVQEATKQGYVDIQPGDCVDPSYPSSKTRRGRAMIDKSNCITAASSELYQYCGTIDKPIYEVKDGFITIKGKQYPIKLKDGYYIIRKLTVRECMRLQTVPEWYEFPVSNAQAYKMLGNGWTIEVIAHLIKSIMENGVVEEPRQIIMTDLIK